MIEKMIECDDLYFKYNNAEGNDQLAIDKLNLSIVKGEFLVILGRNGSGKSTLAKQMNAILLPSGGKVYVGGLDSSNENNLWQIRKSTGMVFQNPDNQLVATIVEEDVAFGPENLGIEPSEIRKRVDEALKKVKMYKYRLHAPHLLSGGQKQRVAIAGILAMKPSCIVFDEPTAMLDPLGRKEVMSTIRDINKNLGITIVLITHNMEEAIEADRIVIMDKGKLLMSGKPVEIFCQVKILKGIGLDVPQVTELAYELNLEGYNIRPDILTINEMVDALCQLR
ncbi:MAG TPA: energy-coupling factor transporter ATPase [Clostridiaceae bacterium]